MSQPPQIGRELRRGTLEMLLLRLLEERAKYGYELVSELDERTGGNLAIKEGTLYPVLYRLEDQGLVAPQWNQPKRGVPRKYYGVTHAGSARLAELEAEWSAFRGMVDELLERPGDHSPNVQKDPTPPEV